MRDSESLNGADVSHPGERAAAPSLGRRLNVISQDSDHEIRELYDLLKAGKRAEAESSVLSIVSNDQLDALDVDLTVDAGARAVDLIGHSIERRRTEPGIYLQIGKWTITYSNVAGFCQAARPVLENKGITKLRLLGCMTAATSGGWATIQELARQLNVVVYGTSRDIWAADYTSQGFMSYDALHASTARGKAELPAQNSPGYLVEARVDETLIRDHLRRETLGPGALGPAEEIIPADLAGSIWDQIDPTMSWSLPGLLTQPSRELLLPAGGGEYYRVQILPRCRAVRVFPLPPSPYEQHGLVYPVRVPQEMDLLLPPFD